MYKKTLRMSTAVRQERSVGQIVNLVANDAKRVQEVTQWLHFLWATPLMLLAVFAISVWIVGWIGTLGGFAVSFLLLPVAWKITRVMGGVRETALSRSTFTL